MSTLYGITPFEPFAEGREWLEGLRIDPPDYERKLLERWPLARKFQGTSDSKFAYRLDWRSADGIRWIGEEIELKSDLQTMLINGAPSPGFVLWHRAFVPSRFRLAIWCAEDDEMDDEILPEATLADIAKILGIDRVGDPRVIFYIARHSEWQVNRAQRVPGSAAWQTYGSEDINAHGYAQCAGAQQVRRLANMMHHGEHGLLLMWVYIDHITSPVEYVELPGVSVPGEAFPRIMGALDGMAIQRVVPYEPGADGTFPWPEDIDDIS